jgi:hypothetical protein
MEFKWTVTTIFIVPTLQVPKDALKSNGFINAYVKDGNREVQYENCIYLLFQPKNLDKFREFLDNEYDRTKAIIDDYDYEDGYVVVVYQLDMKYAKDFSLIKKGKYSKTSPEFQSLFPKVTKLTKNGVQRDEISLQYRVFNKTEDLLRFWEDRLGVEFDDDQELWDIFQEKNEILNIQKIKEDVQSGIV